MAEAVTLPNNFVTVFHSVTADLGIGTPWPKPQGYTPKGAKAILIWGGAFSVGQFAIQILRYYGCTNILTTASKKHHACLHSLGAKWTFDYHDPHVVSLILSTGTLQSLMESKAGIPLILDCIGRKDGSIRPIAKIAKRDSKVAILLPVIVKDSSETEDPEYEMNVLKAADWAEGVDARGVRTHFYLNNEFFKYHLQPDIMYTLLKEKVVEPNAQKIIEGNTMLEKAQRAIDTLRRKEASMERLVWRVSDA